MRNAGLNCDIVGPPEADAEPANAAPAPTTPSPTIPPTDTPTASEQPSEGFNPYQQPSADLAVEPKSGSFDLVDPKKLAAGAGFAWIKEGFQYFNMAPMAWILAIIVYIAIMMVASFIPGVSLITNLINPVFIGGFMLGCYQRYQGENFDVGVLFAGFKRNTGTLVMLGDLILVGYILIAAVSAGLFFALLEQEGFSAMSEGQFPMEFLLVFLVAMSLMLLVVMATWFAPALVVMNNVSAVQALKLSFSGCLRNILPFLLYGIACTFFSVIAAIPLFLGFLVLAPTILASMFAAYREIFTETEAV